MRQLRWTGPIVLVAMLLAASAAVSSAQSQPPQGGEGAGQVAQPGGTLPGNPQIQLVQIASGLVDPVNVAAAGDGSGRLFVVERTGQIRIVQSDGTVVEEPFLDIGDSVKTDFLEQGLLGLAFHPDYQNNGRFFVYYADYATNGNLWLVEYTVVAGQSGRSRSRQRPSDRRDRVRPVHQPQRRQRPVRAGRLPVLDHG